jgi:hypothetical protein
MFPKTILRLAASTGTDLVREEREISPFDKVLMKDYGELNIVQGDRPSLTVEAHPDLLPRIKTEVHDGRLTLGFGSWLDKLGEAFTTSLTRKPIRYTLTVAELRSLEIFGLARVRLDALLIDQLRIKMLGAVDAKLASLTAKRLEVEMPSGGKLSVAGQVNEQQISVSGPGEYEACHLNSGRADIRLNGPGRATVWATDELDVTIRGIGRVNYYGSPSITQRSFGIGRLQRLIRPGQ